MNLEVCGIGHPLGLFFGVFSASSFFLEKQCSLFDSSLPATSLAGCGGGGGVGGTLIESLLAGLNIDFLAKNRQIEKVYYIRTSMISFTEGTQRDNSYKD